MQNIADEKLKADAARLGFHKKPMEGLIKVVEAKVQDEVQKVETKLKIKKEKLSKKLEALRNKSADIKSKVGETKIESETMVTAVSGVFIISMLFYIGYHSTGTLYISCGSKVVPNI